ncbi:MAG: hypothetical protein ACP5L0_02905 [Caldisphaera sp.]|jgi:hypothetical protein|uniref:hypothetical protein n=1 Tax=Caldisphaera sp. TaxID=2060322 RepID=UPI000CBDE825|nr:MAG: hypothetical protein C0202_00695 [Caldisphaera sp.]
MGIKEQYYNFIWDCVRNGLNNDGIISLKRYDQVLNNFLKTYKSFSEIPVYARFYLIVQSFIFTTIDQIIDILINEYGIKDMEGYFQELLDLFSDLRRDIVQEAKEYNVYDDNYKKTLILIDIIRTLIERLIKNI